MNLRLILQAIIVISLIPLLLHYLYAIDIFAREKVFNFNPIMYAAVESWLLATIFIIVYFVYDMVKEYAT